MERMIEVLHESRLANVFEIVGEGRTASTLLVSVVWDDGKSRRTYFKMFHKSLPLGLLNEITGYLLAKSCGLPLPTHAGIIKVPKGLIENQDDFLPHAFVVSEAPGKTPTTICQLTDPITNQQLNAVMGMLRDWPKLNDTIAFDDWAANTDRNLQNIVVDGPGKIYLIDHSNLPVKPNWSASDLQPHEKYRNILVDILQIVQDGKLPQKRAIAVAATQHSDAYNNIIDELEYWWEQFLSADSSRRKAIDDFLRIRAADGHSRLSSNFYLMAV
ncbi:hypothetical protein [Alkalimonas amylolytica]|uniref:Phosphatidylinositol 3-and 4-kinase n=1 Tax=Alkalimonas amylolytica TaxID=152573 RepID=A0A1H3XL24_ALKAM|nr:hypothetical protein [Alkalimonas amylolytica]SDZ99960.1 hypothetical protein SAMN04488051_101289 [Alkalimonas amylolytica]